MATHTSMAQGSDASLRSIFEQRIGIVHFVSPKEHSWHGQTRKRYTDFLVREVTKDGVVVHLHTYHTNTRDLARDSAQAEVASQGSGKPDSASLVKPAATQPSAVTHEPASNIPQTRDPNVEKPKTDEVTVGAVSAADQAILTDLLGETPMLELVSLYSKITQNQQARPASHGHVRIPAINDKSKRSQIHGEIRRIFGGKIDTTTDSDDSIKATAVRGGGRGYHNRQQKNQTRSNDRNLVQGERGRYLHFSLCKENRDTMDAINHIARVLNIKPNMFGTAGTKDRRAVTVQRVSMPSRNPHSLLFLNHKVYGVKIGDFKYEQRPIRLGDNQGNEFEIVLKNCSFAGTEAVSFEEKFSIAKSTVDLALEQIIENGFINYFGTQRFGTHHVGTQEIGVKILKEDFEGAIRALLSSNPESVDGSAQGQYAMFHKDEIARDQACSAFLQTWDSRAALVKLPRNFHVECAIINHLGKQPKDFLGALQAISRSMRTMYVHAFQSLVWNHATSERWERFGNQVVEGDLILIQPEATTASLDGGELGDDEENIHLLDNDTVTGESSRLTARPLTEEEAKNGKFSVFDIVLPTPGWDVIYPSNEIGAFYDTFMLDEANGGLDPHNMRRRNKDFSLPGSYRKIMGKAIGIPSASVREYSHDQEQLIPTDLDLIRARKTKEFAEHQTDRQKASTLWRSFTQNVQQNEREEGRAHFKRQKAEEMAPTPPSRVSDTWIQTSLDGSSKRFKVATHNDAFDSGTTAADSTNRDVTYNTSKSHDDRDISNRVQVGVDEKMADVIDETKANETTADGVGEKMADENDSGKETLSKSPNERHTGLSVVNAVTKQVRTVITILFSAILFVMAALGLTTDQTPTKSTVHYSQADPQPGLNTGDRDSNTVGSIAASRPTPTPIAQPATSSEQTPTIIETTFEGENNSLPATGEAPRSSVVVGEHLSSQVLETLSTDEKKRIAVILRFTLNTSQYATMFLRELQGPHFKSTAESLDATSSPSGEGGIP